MSHGTMKYTLKAHVCYFVLLVGLLLYLYSFHEDFKKSTNQNQELPVAAMIVNESGQNEQSL